MHIKYIGSSFILIGAAIGAGMLALPMVGAAGGFWFSTALLIVIWAIMTITALLILQVNLAFKPYRDNFGTMAEATLGLPGKVISWIAFMLLLYSTTAAYISGSTSLVGTLCLQLFNFHIPPALSSIGYTLVFGLVVFWSTRSVDCCMRFLLPTKGVVLFIVIIFLMPQIDYANLALHSSSAKYLWIAAPIFLNAFGFHFVIPSIATYCDKKVKPLKYIIIFSSTIPLLIYIIWLFVCLGVVPLSGTDSFMGISTAGTSVGGFIGTLAHLGKSKTVLFAINVFSNIAITTSFLGVSLGLFDFIADGFKRKNTRSGRLQTALLTFTLPLLFALFYPNGFIVALEYSAFFAIILEIFLPVFMVYKLKKSKDLASPYNSIFSSNICLVCLTVIGCILIGIIILDTMHCLPHICYWCQS